MRQLKDNPNYLVTLDGRVFSLHTMSYLKNFLKAGDYVYVKIGKKSHRVHRLVAQTYISNPENKPQVNHIDGNKENNHLSNVRILCPNCHSLTPTYGFIKRNRD